MSFWEQCWVPNCGGRRESCQRCQLKQSSLDRDLQNEAGFHPAGSMFGGNSRSVAPPATCLLEIPTCFIRKVILCLSPHLSVTYMPHLSTFDSLTQVIIAAARQLGKSVIWCHDAKREGQAETTDFTFALPCDGQTTAEDVFEIEYVPFDWLLPRVSVTVCHGGAGTLWHSFRSGMPCVVCPMLSALFADQVTHADFVARAGLGTRVLELNPSIEACKAALLAAQSCSAACQRIATKLQQEDGSVKAAAAIERISAEKETAQYPKTPRSNVCLPCF